MKIENPLVESYQLWAGTLEARAKLYIVSENNFELYTSVGNEVPHRHVGSLGIINSVLDAWLYQREKQGFVVQCSSFNPECFRN